MRFVCFQEEDDDDDEDDEEEDEEEEEEEEDEEGSEDNADEEEADYPKLPQVGTILYRLPQQPPLPPSPQTQPQPQPPPPSLQAAFVPIQPLPDYNPADYPGSTSPELQRVLVGQQMLGQQQQCQGQQIPGLGPGMIPQPAPDGLMVATPAQTLTDTLDDIMAGKNVYQKIFLDVMIPTCVFLILFLKNISCVAVVSSRVPTLNTTTSPTPPSQPPTQTPTNIASPPSALPLYPSVDIDAHVRSKLVLFDPHYSRIPVNTSKQHLFFLTDGE